MHAGRRLDLPGPGIVRTPVKFIVRLAVFTHEQWPATKNLDDEHRFPFGSWPLTHTVTLVICELECWKGPGSPVLHPSPDFLLSPFLLNTHMALRTMARGHVESGS